MKSLQDHTLYHLGVLKIITSTYETIYSKNSQPNSNNSSGNWWTLHIGTNVWFLLHILPDYNVFDIGGKTLTCG